MRKTDNTRAERYRRWEERTRATGRQRLTVWIPAEAFSRLRVLAQTRGASLAETVAALIMGAREERPKAVRPNVSANAGLDTRIEPLVRDWRAQGVPWIQCAKRLDALGLKTPEGGQWDLGKGRTNLARFFKSA